MNIGLQTWGTDGDFMPFLALAIGLKEAGHQVTLAYTSVDGKNYSNRLDVEGIKLISADDNIVPNLKVNPYALDTKSGHFREYSKLLDIYFEPYTDAMYQASEQLCMENDLVIGHAACVTLQMASEKHDCPRVSLVLTPLVVKSKFVSPIGMNLGTILNTTMWKVGDFISSKAWFKKAQDIRKQEGLKSIRSLQEDVFTSSLATIIATSESLTPVQTDWKDSVKVTGFLNVPSKSSNWQMPTDLEEFIEQGEPPIYMTFGSCMQYDLEESTKVLVEAAKISGKRAIIQSDWTKLSIEIDKNTYPITMAPHSNIFPHCSLIVHHGGAGTTQAALLAGNPSVVVPHGFDQPYWGSLLFGQNLAPVPIPRKSLNPHKLARILKRLTTEEHLKQKASDIGAQMRRENGITKAVQLINELTKNDRRRKPT
jgi:UDP:flavonoid glycosyltransferase YjiC (YdhE family)